MRLRQILEQDGKTAVFAFGRMNPPTIGHSKLVDVVKNQPGDPYLFLSHTQKPKTDPLSFAEKVFFARKCFGDGITIGNENVRTIIDCCKFLYNRKYTDLIYVAGEDRIKDFDTLLNKYNGGDDYQFNSINVISAGQRDPDAEGAEGMSASKMKAAAVVNDLQTFKGGVCSPDPKVARMLFNKVRAGLGIQEEDIQVIEYEDDKPSLSDFTDPGTPEELAQEIYFRGFSAKQYQAQYKTWEDFMNSEDFQMEVDRLRSKFEDENVSESEADFYQHLYKQEDGQFYRGEGKGGKGLGLGALGKGIYLTWTESAANAFSIHHGADGEIVKYKVKPGLKIADYQSKEVSDIKAKMGFQPWEYSGDQMYSAILTMDLKEAGYDGVVSDKAVEGLVIFDASNVTRIEEGEPNS